MPKANFTDRKIASLKKPKTGQVDYFDEGTKGFGIRVSQGGTKTWFLKFFLNNKQGRWRLGEYPALSLAEARKKALAGKHDVMHGINPSIQQRIDRAALSFKDLADKFVEEHGKAKKRTWAEDQRILNKYFVPFHDRKAGDIHRLEIHDRLQDIKRAHGGIMANRALACVRKAYSFGVRSGSVEENPALLVDAAVSDIISRVRKDGDTALLELSEKYDAVVLNNLEVTADEWANAESSQRF